MNLFSKGSGVFLANWVLFPIYLVTNIIVIRLLGAEGKGVLAILGTTAMFFAGLGHFGFPAAAIYFLKSNQVNERSLLAYFSLIVAAFTLLFGAMVFAGQAVFIRLFMEGIAVSPVWLWMTIAWTPLLLMNNYLSTLVLAQGHVRDYTVIHILSGLGNLAATAVIVGALNGGITGGLAAALLTQGAVAAVWVGRSLAGTRGQAVVLQVPGFARCVGFGLRQYVATLGSQLFKRADNFLLAYFLDMKAVGYYSVALIPYDVVLSVPRALTTLLTGEISGGHREDNGRLIVNASRVASGLTLGMAVVLGPVAIPAVPWLFGRDFTAALAPLQLLLAASIFLGFTMVLQAYFLGSGRPDLNGNVTLFSGLVNLGLSVCLIPLWGLGGNALATLIAAAIGAVINLHVFSNLSGVPRTRLFSVRSEDIRLMKDSFRAWRRSFPRFEHE